MDARTIREEWELSGGSHHRLPERRTQQLQLVKTYRKRWLLPFGRTASLLEIFELDLEFLQQIQEAGTQKVVGQLPKRPDHLALFFSVGQQLLELAGIFGFGEEIRNRTGQYFRDREHPIHAQGCYPSFVFLQHLVGDVQLVGKIALRKLLTFPGIGDPLTDFQVDRRFALACWHGSNNGTP